MISWCSSGGFLLLLLAVFCCPHLKKKLTGLFFAFKTNKRPALGCVWWCFWGHPASFLSSGLSVLFCYLLCFWKKIIVPFGCFAVWKAGRYCGCTSVCPRLCRRDRARLFRQHHTYWVTLQHRDHNFMEHRGKKGKNKCWWFCWWPSTTCQRTTRKMEFNMQQFSVDFFVWPEFPCVCSVPSLLLWPSCSCCAKQERLRSKPVTTG